MEERWRVELPPAVRAPFAVFVNGVPQQEGVDYDLAPGATALLFRRELGETPMRYRARHRGDES